jgi:hypothetical protein
MLQATGARLCVCLIAAVLALALVGPAQADVALNGRSVGIYAKAPNLGYADNYYWDTGFLPSQGGNLIETADETAVSDLFQVASITASSDGDDCEGDSHVSIESAVLLPGHAAEITFSSLHTSDDDECCLPSDEDDDNHGDDDYNDDDDGDDDDGDRSAVIADLTFGGNPVTVTGEFNQQVDLAGVGTLVINERWIHVNDSSTSWWDDDDGWRHDDDDDGADECDDDDTRDSALHLYLASGDEITVGSTYFHSDDDCCPVSTEPATWGNVKKKYE